MGGDQGEIIPSPSKAVNRWLNVVLDLNGILYVCEEYKFLPKIQSNPHSSSVPTKIGSKAIYIYLLCSRFLSELSDFADITIWSSMHKSTTRQICKYLFRELHMPLHIIGQDSCDQIYIMGRNNRVTTMKVKGIHKDIFLKTLSSKLFGRFNGKFPKDNTIVIDNRLVMLILNNSKNVLPPMP